MQAQSDPAYETALITIFDVLHKYVDRAAELSASAQKTAHDATDPKGDSLADLAPVTLEVDPELDLAITTIRKLLNRFGNGVDP